MTDTDATVDNESRRRWYFWLGGAGVLVVLIAVVLVLTSSTFEYRMHPERRAYDDGATFGHVRSGTAFDDLNCRALTDAKMEMPQSRYEERLRWTDQAVLGVAEDWRAEHEDYWEPKYDVYFLMGFWDGMVERCLVLYDDRPVVGRP
jgi:hypothetical protein